ncbi:MAG: aldehyde dehydrogenase family protein [Phycisphaeraceae bacterium]|nr:aldehyde dehydrogenase family protein [Phycisphaeraceae bacterium]
MPLRSEAQLELEPRTSDGARPVTEGMASGVDAEVARAREAWALWRQRSVTERLGIIARFKHLIVEHARDLAGAITFPRRESVAESISAEVLPLADACRFLERSARRALKPRRVRRGRPWWLMGHRLTIHRQPLGVILIIGPFNYPLMLIGVQLIQALVAGNAVVIKPGQGGGEAARMLVGLLVRAGLDENLVRVLDESPDSARRAIEAGVDKVILTGSARTGRAVMEACAPKLTSSIMELSGCDAMIVLSGADLEMVADSAVLGLRFNASCTCIAPRRLFIPDEPDHPLPSMIEGRLADLPPVELPETTRQPLEHRVREALEAGAVLWHGDIAELRKGGPIRPLLIEHARPDMALLNEDIFAPVLSIVRYRSTGSLIEAVNGCRYGLGASLFGPERPCRSLASELAVGVVSINDYLAPLADPRLPLEGVRHSGFGPTRGVEGLLAMTRSMAVSRRGGRQRPHLQPIAADDAELFLSYLRLVHGRGLFNRLSALPDLLRSLVRKARTMRATRKDNPPS